MWRQLVHIPRLRPVYLLIYLARRTRRKRRKSRGKKKTKVSRTGQVTTPSSGNAVETSQGGNTADATKLPDGQANPTQNAADNADQSYKVMLHCKSPLFFFKNRFYIMTI